MRAKIPTCSSCKVTVKDKPEMSCYCRPCRCRINREYKAKNREKIQEKRRAEYHEDRENILAYAKLTREIRLSKEQK